ncbi:hypothetical protein GMOD_00008638 [Pyrenophora seminiperda CCB06]|uniref:Uncharacterized protein n=1 Tax=Pyrenophora seminiperda CCB06 TaxID=1302712 RepID=A0A3M7M951_9PLEO|nr:hypothetical protein GMOD_00008638 [Pyrenophora seminiperda CCB06]
MRPISEESIPMKTGPHHVDTEPKGMLRIEDIAAKSAFNITTTGSGRPTPAVPAAPNTIRQSLRTLLYSSSTAPVVGKHFEAPIDILRELDQWLGRAKTYKDVKKVVDVILQMLEEKECEQVH